MILAPNHPLQLNGNKIGLVIFILSLILMQSCSTTKSVYKPSDTTPVEPVEDVVAVTKIDTVEWDVVSEEEMPPMTSDDSFTQEYDKKAVYNIAMMLPIEAQKPDASTRAVTDNTTTNRFVSFYAGALMALTDLEREGVNLSVDVYDTQRNADKVDTELNSIDFKNMDAIIGPYASTRNKQGLINTAEFGKANEITVISPWYASSSLAKENPYYVQLRPNLEDHYRRMLEHAKENFSDSQIILLGRTQSDSKKARSDKNRIKYIQQIHKELSGSAGTRDLRVFDAHPDSLLVGEIAFDSLFIEPGEKAVIIPYYTSSDESFVYNSLRRINGEKSLDPVHVYTMPLALEAEQIDFNLYRNLNMKIVRSKYVDRTDATIRKFENEYYNQFGAIPNNDAYHGYDVMYFVGSNLKEYGRNFQFFVDETQEYLQSSFRLEKVPLKDAEGSIDDRMAKFNYFVNKHLDIIEFQGESFSRSE